MSSLEIASSLNGCGHRGDRTVCPTSDRPIFNGQFVMLSAQHSQFRIGEASFFLLLTSS
ncbi:hypothetical protein [Nostoc sp. FACHB-888]|uniref:hypothetical protein n=1 Tax=Nostoc sp. FACHB-888 TaxID=2692842 RepID=UPI001683364A|nr:hypothetical protein [Nostoc sp. FACHB-888]MBD2248866.1 hypothetical protein [Nostoc sp. FACHB-888]